MSFLVDTAICSAYLKGSGPVTNRFVQYGGQLSMSTVTLGELHAWVRRAKAPPHRRKSLDDLSKLVALLPVDEAVAEKFGEVQAWQLDHGLATPEQDLLNASVALVHGLILVTHNTRDYRNVPGLQSVDWLVP